MASLSVIKKDEIGLYAFVGGYVVRPTQESRFSVGESVKGHHFGGSTNVGMGKDPFCKKGQYLETWQTYGTAAYEYQTTTIEKQKQSWEWYREFSGRSIQELIDMNARLPE